MDDESPERPEEGSSRPRRRKKKKRKPRPTYVSNYDIEVVRLRCTGIMTCMDYATRVFELDEDSVAIVVNPNGNSDEDILASAQSCPVDAIILTDKVTGDRVWPPREKRFVR